jgi:hypothetical protein
MIGKVAGVGLGTLCSRASVPILVITCNVGNICFHLLTICCPRTEPSERQTPFEWTRRNGPVMEPAVPEMGQQDGVQSFEPV